MVHPSGIFSTKKIAVRRIQNIYSKNSNDGMQTVIYLAYDVVCVWQKQHADLPLVKDRQGLSTDRLSTATLGQLRSFFDCFWELDERVMVLLPHT